MAFEDYRETANVRARATTLDVVYDAGLRQHMVGVFNHMFAGLALSGTIALLLVQTGASALFFAGPGQFTLLGCSAAGPQRPPQRVEWLSRADYAKT